MEADFCFGCFPPLEKLVESVSTARLLALMKFAEIKLFMVLVLFFFCQAEFQWLEVARGITSSGRALQVHIGFNTLGKQGKTSQRKRRKKSLVVCSWFVAVRSFLTWMLPADPASSPVRITKVEENCRGRSPLGP